MNINKIEILLDSFRYSKHGLSSLRDIAYMDYTKGYDRAFKFEEYLYEVFLTPEVVNLVFDRLDLENLSEIWDLQYDYALYVVMDLDYSSVDDCMYALKKEFLYEILKYEHKNRR